MTHPTLLVRSLLLSLLLGLGCTTVTTVEEAWQTPDLPAGGFRSVGVIGLAERSEMRSYHERNFVDRLAAAGIRAVASETGLPDTSALDREVVQAWAAREGVETVLTTRLVDIEQEEWTVPSESNAYWDRPDRGARDVQAQAVTYRLETRLFESSSARLLFSARTQSVRPVSPHSVVLSVIGTLVDELTARGLLEPEAP